MAALVWRGTSAGTEHRVPPANPGTGLFITTQAQQRGGQGHCARPEVCVGTTLRAQATGTAAPVFPPCCQWLQLLHVFTRPETGRTLNSLSVALDFEVGPPTHWGRLGPGLYSVLWALAHVWCCWSWTRHSPKLTADLAVPQDGYQSGTQTQEADRGSPRQSPPCKSIDISGTERQTAPIGSTLTPSQATPRSRWT